MTKIFDFEHADFLRHQQKVREWMITHYHKSVTEDEYVAAMKELRKGISGMRARRSRSASRLRRHYRTLNIKFGFFQEAKKG